MPATLTHEDIKGLLVQLELKDIDDDAFVNEVLNMAANAGATVELDPEYTPSDEIDD